MKKKSTAIAKCLKEPVPTSSFKFAPTSSVARNKGPNLTRTTRDNEPIEIRDVFRNLGMPDRPNPRSARPWGRHLGNRRSRIFSRVNVRFYWGKKKGGKKSPPSTHPPKPRRRCPRAFGLSRIPDMIGTRATGPSAPIARILLGIGILLQLLQLY